VYYYIFSFLYLQVVENPGVKSKVKPISK